jgi:hypothetical protein
MTSTPLKIGGAVNAIMHSKSGRIDVRAGAPVMQLLQAAGRVAHKNARFDASGIPGADMRPW